MLDFIARIALEAGNIALSERENMSDSAIHYKNDKDIVTDVDRKIENFIVREIQKTYPEHGILGEEHGRSGNSDSEYLWVIDPIDGTTSYAHGQFYYSVSIALLKNSKPILAAVYAPRLNENFTAALGKGAFLNGKRIYVSKRDKLINSVLATGFACLRAGMEDNNLPAFNRIVPKLRGIRRCGSAALDMANVACGRFEGFWERNLNLYDIAAGDLIVREAGGMVTDFHDGSDYPAHGTLATNGLVHAELVHLLNLKD